MTNANSYFPGGSGGTPTAAGLVATDPITVNWRTTTAGDGVSAFENVTDRALLSLEGNGGNWNYNAAAYYSGSRVEHNFTDGYVSYDGIDAALQGNAGAVHLNPFGPQNAAGQSYLTSPKVLGPVQTIDGTLWGINGTASSDLMNLPAGPLTLAIGVDYRQEEIDYKNNFALIRQAASSGLELAQDTQRRPGRVGVDGRTQHPDHQEPRPHSRAALRRLQRCRHQLQPEGCGPLSADRYAAVARVVQQWFPRADAV